MIQSKTLDELEALLEKARVKFIKLNPAIEIVGDGVYRVQGSKGNWYEVRIGRTETGEHFIACLCRGSLEGLGCFHAACAFYKDKSIQAIEARLRESEAMETAPYFSGGNIKDEDKPKPQVYGNIKI